MLTETEIRTRHPHVIEGTVRFCPIRNKQVCTIRTRGVDGTLDGNTREIATSDLHQTFWTVEVKKLLDKAAAKAKRAEKRTSRLPQIDEVKAEGKIEVDVLREMAESR